MNENNKKVLILVVEDERILINLLEEKLLAEGFEVIKALEGETGLELALSKHPDLILLDLLMPENNGVDMLKKLRDDPWGKAVPVIVLTNLTGEDERLNIDILKLNVTNYFLKVEIGPVEIISKIKETLGINK